MAAEASVTAVENGGGVVEAVRAAVNAAMDDAAVFGVDTECFVEDSKSNPMNNVVSGVRVVDGGKMVSEAVWRMGRRIGGPETKTVILVSRSQSAPEKNLAALCL